MRTLQLKGFDVLLCTDDVDEFVFKSMNTWQEKELKNIQTADLDLASDDEKEIATKVAEENKEMFEAMKEILGLNISKIEVSATSMEAPARLTAGGPVSLEMERILSMGPDADQIPRAERVLLLNAQHSAFETLKTAFAEGDKKKLRLYTDLLYNQALLVEGLPVEDPITFAEEICKLM